MRKICGLIKAYRKTLEPAIYILSAKRKGGTISDIEETVLEYTSQEDRDRHGVILVYYPLNLPLKNIQILTTIVDETPQKFQIKLIQYLDKKLDTRQSRRKK